MSAGGGFLEGLNKVYNAVPERFDMILEKSNPEYMNLPGIGVLIGGGVKISPSPTWLQNRLKAIGVSPKNNVVDVLGLLHYHSLNIQ